MNDSTCQHPDSKECDCPCHTTVFDSPEPTDILQHIVACCQTCPSCHKRIVINSQYLVLETK